MCPVIFQLYLSSKLRRTYLELKHLAVTFSILLLVLYHSANVPESSQSSSVPNVPRYSDKEEEERIRWNLHDRHQQHNHHQRHHHHYQNQQQYYPKSESSHDEEKGFTTAVFMMIAGCVAAVIGIPLKCMIESLYINSKLIAECEKVRKDNVRKAKHLQKKLKRTVEKELPQMRKHLIVLERDVSRYASLQKLNSD